MARNRRSFSPFSLSFLDVMSCGFGAVVLLFLIIKHHVDAVTPSPLPTAASSSEVKLLEEDVKEGKENLAQLRNTIDEIEKRIVIARGLARRVMEKIKETSGDSKALSAQAQNTEIEKLKENLKKLQAEKKRLEEKTDNAGQDTRSFTGEGNRQYLTGLKMGGNRILVLLDVSASMLDETLVNVIRRRNMPDDNKTDSKKWKQALAIVDWLSTRFPVTGKFQIYAFNTEVNPVIADTKGKWLETGNTEQLNKAIENVKKIVPANGTSLENAFLAAGQLNPLPDNIFLITDGLPTQGEKPPRNTTVTGKQRLSLFDDALRKLPQNIPVNAILLPMEGDPMAASAFWQLAQITRGSFMSPTGDWP